MNEYSEQNENLEDEKLMAFLSENSSATPELSPMFAKNTIRKIRLEETAPQSSLIKTITSWFSHYSTPILGSVAALTIATALWLNSESPFSDTKPAPTLTHQPVEEKLPSLEENDYSQFSEDLLIMAAEDVDFLTDSEVLALLY